MSKTVFRYFFDFLDGQEKWLNEMAQRGYRLKKCGRVSYTFDECKPSEYEYAVEFVGDKSYAVAKDYRVYLEGMGFCTFTKNININFSYSRVRWRPYAKGMGQTATSPGGFNKELLILEKRKDGKPFELHTDVSDKLEIYKTVRRTYVYAMLIMLGLLAITFIPGVSSLSVPATGIFRVLVGICSILFLVPTAKYSTVVGNLKEESKIFE